MGAAAQKWADICYVTSDNPRTEDPGEIIRNILDGMDRQLTVAVEPDRRKAIALALEEARAGDIVILLGKGHETYQEVNGARVPFDEREIVKGLI
jgi:UDP-N-acetylmuramoyl-L-alanyl-D-glutamate--2,6-diaminopimelate ligase